MKNLFLQGTLWCESFYPQRKVSVTSADLAIEKNELQGRSKSAISLLTPHHSSGVSVSSQTSARVAQEWLKSIAVILLFFTFGVGQIWGTSITYTFTNKSWNANNGSGTANWTCNTAGSSFESTGSARGVANNGVNGDATSPVSFANVNSISVVASSNTTGGKVQIKIGSTSIANKSIANSNNATYTYNSSDLAAITDLSGTITIHVTKPSSKTVYVKSVTIVYCDAAPTSLTNTTIGSTTATLGWSDAKDIGSYEVYRSTSSTAPGYSTTPTTTVNAKSVELTGLSTSTEYNWWVRSNCGTGCKSKWVAGTSFTTTASASCDNVPTVTAGSLKGSVTSSSSATVQCSSGISNIGGTGCSLTSYGFAVGTSRNPTIGGTLTGTGKTYEAGTSIAASTSFEKLIDGLQANTTYHVRSYATNGAGTGYGDDFTFKTLAACTAAPTVTAGSKGTITSTSAVLNCSSGISVLGTGGCAIESYGFVMNTTGTPTITDTKYEVGTTYTTTGTSFTKTVSSGLTEGTTYYVRPYATNGYNTGYGDQVSFGTPKITVSTTSLAFGDKKVGGTYTETFTVSGVNLQGNITITPNANCSGLFSVDKNSITPVAGTVTNEEITITYTPTTAGSHGGGSVYINVESSNAQTRSVMPTGTGKWEVTWNNNGSTSTTLVANNEKPTFPSTPSACDANSTTFIGWATAPWSGKIQNLSGKTVHTVNSTMSNITANGTTYYAVFAKDGSKAVRVTDYTSLAAGTAIVIVNNYSTSRYILLSTFATAQTPTYSGDDISISNSNQYWWLTGNNTDGFTLKSGDGKTLGTANTNSQTLVSNTTANSLWIFGALTDEYSECISMTNKSATYPIEYSSGWKIYNTSSESWMAMRIYKVNFSDFITTCCDKNVALSGGSPSNGTITFKEGVNAVTSVQTCGSNKEITMKITPAAGYKLTAWSTSSSTVTPTDTDPSVAITGDDSKSEQTITLTFAQGANGNYTGAATFTAMTDYFIDKLHYDVNTAYEDPGVSKSGTYTVPTPSNGGDPSDDSCAELHYKFVGWVPESDVNSSGGVTSTANMLTAGTANHAASDVTYYAIWAKEQ